MRAYLLGGLLSIGALLPGAAPAQSPPFEATGEVVFVGGGAASSGASFSDDRVVGPVINMTRRDDGGWAGDLNGQNLDLAVTPDRIEGSNVDLHVERKGTRIEIRGLVFGRRVNLTIDDKGLSGRVGICSYDLSRKGRAFLRGDVGCVATRTPLPLTGRAALRLEGVASEPEPPMPQFAFALIAILPG